METQDNLPQGQQQIDLPYEALPEALSRNDQRDLLKNIGGTIARQTLRIPIDQIAVRQGFNWRVKPDDISEDQWLYDENHLGIRSLADGILASGYYPPLTVDLTPEGIAPITDGFRRYMALLLLIRDGHTTLKDRTPINMVEVFVNNKAVTELDRMRAVFSTQENKKLKPHEIALGLARMKSTFHLSNEEISSAIGKSRQWVDNYINLAGANQVVHNAIESGIMPVTAAVALKHSPITETEKVHLVEEAIAAGTPIKVADISRQERKEKQENQLQFEFNDADMSEDQRKAEHGCRSAISKCDQLRNLLKGLNDQAQKDGDQKLDWIIKDIEETVLPFIRSAHKR